MKGDRRKARGEKQLSVVSCQLSVNSKLKTQNSRFSFASFLLAAGYWLLAAGCWLPPAPCHAKAYKETLKNGLVVLVDEENHSGVASATLLVKAGSSVEPDSLAGLTYLTQKTMLAGNVKYSEKDVSRILGETGSSLETSVSADYGEISLTTSSRSFKQTFSLFANLLLKPSFTSERIKNAREEILGEVESEEKKVFTLTHGFLKEKFYGEHPYHLPENGSVKTLERIAVKDAQSFYKNYFYAGNAVLSISVSLPRETVLALIKEMFSSFPSGNRESVSTPQPVNPPKGAFFIQKNTEYGWLMAGFAAPPVTGKEYAALKVLDYILGDPESGYLEQDLVGKLRVAVEARSFYPARRGTSYFTIFVLTYPEQAGKALKGVRWELARLKFRAVSQAELERAKANLVSNFLLDHQYSKLRAFYLAYYELMGLGYEFDEKYPETIRQVSPEEIKHTARNYLKEYTLAGIFPTNYFEEKLRELQ